VKKFSLETLVGLFMLAGFLSLAYLAIKLGDVEFFGTSEYRVKALFGNVSGLTEGSDVEIAGVKVGKVAHIYLDDASAKVEMLINPGVKIPDDSIASIRTQGLIGDKYIKISPGGSEENVGPGGLITETESAVDIEELISKYIFDKKE